MRLKRNNFHTTVWKNEKFTLTEKKFRQINCLVISLVKPMLSRNFCEKCVRENFYNLHTVGMTRLGSDLKGIYVKRYQFFFHPDFFLPLHQGYISRNDNIMHSVEKRGVFCLFKKYSMKSML